ncbi:MAG: cell division protein FtsW [Armatimonadetes bacterium RBG_16_58_9]|nr:MAG: cell division protein FtsW [Armatimonadetes bacterium RBG_16_58_9]
MRSKPKLRPPDIWLLGTVFVLVATGVLLVFDASYSKAVDAKWANYDTWYFAKRQLVFAVLGLFALLVVSQTRLTTLLKATFPILIVAFVSLVAVLIIGTAKNGARRWIDIGPVSFQPSELAKIALVLYLAALLTQRRNMLKRLSGKWVGPLMVVGLLTILILAGRDLGTAIALVGTCFVMFFAAGARKRHLFGAGALGCAAAYVLIRIEPYRMERIKTWLDPWRDPYGEGYQIIHSLIAHGTGGMFGVGLCEGREKTYLPAASTDFIFSTLAEEAGLIGALILLFLFAIVVYRGLDIARRSKSTYANLLAVGATSVIGLQALINIAVASSAIPATGIPLPFISYGGSSLLFALIAVGALLAASRQVDVELEDRELYENSYNGWRDGRAHIPRDKRRSGDSRRKTGRRAVVHR